MSRIERSMNRVIDSIDELDMGWIEDMSALIDEYADLDDDSPEQDAAMYTYTDDVGLFEVFMAAYLYCVDYHEGQCSDEYKVLSKLKTAGLQVCGQIESQDESIQHLFERMVAVHHA